MVVTACIFISLEAEYTEDSHLILVGMVAQLSEQSKLLQQNKANFAWNMLLHPDQEPLSLIHI